MFSIQGITKFFLLLNIISIATYEIEYDICIRKQLKCKHSELNEDECKISECNGKHKHKCGIFCSLNKEDCDLFQSTCSNIDYSISNMTLFYKNNIKNLSLIKTCQSYKWNTNDVCLKRKTQKNLFSYLNLNFGIKEFFPCSKAYNYECLNIYCTINETVCDELKSRIDKETFKFKTCYQQKYFRIIRY